MGWLGWVVSDIGGFISFVHIVGVDAHMPHMSVLPMLFMVCADDQGLSGFARFGGDDPCLAWSALGSHGVSWVVPTNASDALAGRALSRVWVSGC